MLAVINYHKIDPRPDIGLTSRSPDDFRRDLDVIEELGWQPLTFRQWMRLSSQGTEGNYIVLTFDDAYHSVLRYAFPILGERGWPGVIFVPTAYIGKSNDWDVQFGGRKFRHLDKEELRTLCSYGFEIASHGHTHRSLIHMSTEEAAYELTHSKNILEDIVQKPVISIAYPFGRFDRRVIKIARKVGYRFGLASIHFPLAYLKNGYSDFAIRRFNIYRFDGKGSVRRKVLQRYKSFLGLRDWLIQRGGTATIIWQKLFIRGIDP